MSTRRHVQSGGFTLVEVLVALLILAVLSGMAWQGIDGMSRARNGSQAQMERSLRMNTVVAQWEQDLGALYDSAVVPALAFDGATVRLVRTVDAGVQMVAWSLRGSGWQRWAGPVVTRAGELQDSWLRSQQLLGNEPGQLLMLQEVSQIQLYFFRGGWSNAQSTGDLARNEGGVQTKREALPNGVRLVLVLGEQTLTRDLMLGPQNQ
jgi:general secretion pathway protein J